MKHTDMMKRLTALTTLRLGFDGASVLQGSAEWHQMRLGVISASRASDLIASGSRAPFPSNVEILTEGRGKNTVIFGDETFTGTKADCIDFVRDLLPRVPSAARKQYLLELVAEVATGQAKDIGKFKQTEWGHEHEESARQIFGFHVGVPVNSVPFIYGNESMRYGCSPDGIADDNSGIEIKSPWTTDVYLDFLLNGEIKPEYVEQCQFSMFVTGMPYWHFANYDPRMRTKSFHSILIERDEERMKTFADAIGQMTHDMDVTLAKIGLSFGDQWSANNSTQQFHEAA